MPRIAPLIALLFLASCQSTPALVPGKLPISIRNPDPLVLSTYEWKIIRENGEVYYALTPDGYLAFSGNLAEVRRYITQQQAIIKAQKDYINK